MSIELADVEKFEGSIANTESEELEVRTPSADYVQIVVDDGTTGGTPNEYDLTRDYYIPKVDDYMRYATLSGQTSTGFRNETRGAKLRLTFTNTSGADAQYRIVVQTFKQI